MKNEYEENLKQLQGRNDYLKKNIGKEDHRTEQQNDKFKIFEKQLKDIQLASATSSYSKFIGEEFKQLTYIIHYEYYQGMVNLFKGFDEMKQIYNGFKHQLDIFHHHHRRTKE